MVDISKAQLTIPHLRRTGDNALARTCTYHPFQMLVWEKAIYLGIGELTRRTASRNKVFVRNREKNCRLWRNTWHEVEFVLITLLYSQLLRNPATSSPTQCRSRQKESDTEYLPCASTSQRGVFASGLTRVHRSRAESYAAAVSIRANCRITGLKFESPRGGTARKTIPGGKTKILSENCAQGVNELVGKHEYGYRVG